MRKLLIILLVGFSLQGTAQVSNPDSMYHVANSMAHRGQYDSCIDLCNKVLMQYPDYVDYSILKARCYVWRGDLDYGIQILQTQIVYFKNNYELYSLITDLLRRKGDHELQVAVCNKALYYFPNNKEFLLKKANAHIALEQDSTAINTLDTLLFHHPSHKIAKQLRYNLKVKPYNTYVWASTTQESFSDFFDNRSLSFVEIKHSFKEGTIVGRVNQANRFGLTGTQFEGDFYFSIDSSSYGLINAGYSDAVSLFPKNRIGVEYYRFLHPKFRVSIGLRYLNFQPDDTTTRNTTIYTGSLSYLLDNSSFTFQPFITPVSNGTVTTYIFKYQQIFSNQDHYLRLEAGSGFSPDSWRNPSLTLQQRVDDDAFLLQSRRVSAYYQMPLGFKFILNAQVMYEQQELVNNQNTFIDVLGLTGGIKYRF